MNKNASAVTVPRWFHYGFLALAAGLVYLDLFVLPATPIAAMDLDQWLYLHNAARMFDGQMIYRDFFQFTPPGTELTYLAIFKLFGTRAWVPNATLVVLGFCLTWLGAFMGRKILSGWTAYLPACMFLALSFHPAIDGAHHWFSMLAAMAALALMIPEVSRARIMGAGVLCAIASFFTQPRGIGVVLALALFLFWKNRQRGNEDLPLWKMQTLLFSSFIVATVGLNLYFVYEAGWKRFWWCTVIFGLKYYPAESKLNGIHSYLAYPSRLSFLPHVPEPGWILIHVMVPFVFLFFFAYWWRAHGTKPQEPWNRIMLISLVGFFLFLGVSPAAITWRMQVIALPAILVFVWLIESPRKWAMAGRCVLWAWMVAVMTGVVWNHQTRWRAVLDTPTGRAAFFESGEFERFKWLAEHTHPSEAFFDCSGRSYYLLGLRSPAMVSFLSGTDYLRPEQVRNLVESLEAKRVHVVIWCPDLDVATRPDDHLGPLRVYLQSHYHPAETSEELSGILERDPQPLSP